MMRRRSLMRCGTGSSIPRTASPTSSTSCSRQGAVVGFVLLGSEKEIAHVRRHWIALFRFDHPKVLWLLLPVVLMAIFGPIWWQLLAILILIISALLHWWAWRVARLVVT